MTSKDTTEELKAARAAARKAAKAAASAGAALAAAEAAASAEKAERERSERRARFLEALDLCEELGWNPIRYTGRPAKLEITVTKTVRAGFEAIQAGNASPWDVYYAYVRAWRAADKVQLDIRKAMRAYVGREVEIARDALDALNLRYEREVAGQTVPVPGDVPALTDQAVEALVEINEERRGVITELASAYGEADPQTWQELRQAAEKIWEGTKFKYRITLTDSGGGYLLVPDKDMYVYPERTGQSITAITIGGAVSLSSTSQENRPQTNYVDLPPVPTGMGGWPDTFPEWLNKNANKLAEWISPFDGDIQAAIAGEPTMIVVTPNGKNSE